MGRVLSISASRGRLDSSNQRFDTFLCYRVSARRVRTLRIFAGDPELSPGDSQRTQKDGNGVEDLNEIRPVKAFHDGTEEAIPGDPAVANGSTVGRRDV